MSASAWQLPIALGTLRWPLVWCLLALLGVCGPSFASMGLDTLADDRSAGPITVFYPSDAPASVVKRGPFTLDVAWKGQPIAGNRRLIVISHGSGGSPWPQSDLARVLVEAGFVVAMPEHAGDNWHDSSKVGPASWSLRPAEVSQAIDAVIADPRFIKHLSPDRVGVYGMSAGGHTALVMAGGRWSPALFARHCNAHIADDFPACVGLFMRLEHNWLDPFKIGIARQILNWRFFDTVWRRHHDPRVRAVVAAVPVAADFDLTTLARPRVPLGLIEAGKDAWLAPRFHVGAVREVCAECVVIADLPGAGHGSTLSPMPLDVPDSAARLLADPPGFDRRKLTDVYRSVAQFFTKNLLP